MRKVKKRGVIKSKIKRGDNVVFVTGKEFNRYQKVGDKVERVPYQGKVIAVDPTARKVKVDGAMIVKKHRKPNPQLNVQGGIVKQEAWVDASNVALLDPKTGKPTRVKIEVRDGEKVRVAKSGEVIPIPNPFARVETKESAEAEETKESAEAEETKAEAEETKAEAEETKESAEAGETKEDSAEETDAKEEKKAEPKKKKKSKKADEKSEDKSEEE